MRAAVSHVSLGASYTRHCSADGTLHFSDVKRLNQSGAHYIHAVNERRVPTRPMLVSTAVHQILLGPRKGKEVVVYPGLRRMGKEWDSFEAMNPEREILTKPEWDDAQRIARIIEKDPQVQARLDSARTEVPLTWKDGDFLCSTDGIDIVRPGEIGDLKGTHNAEPEAWKRLAFRMLYHVQVAWYRRGCVANGIDVSKGAFVLGYEMSAPHVVVDLQLTPDLLELGDRTLTLWLEKLKVYRDSNQWPGYAQAPVLWDVPKWLKPSEDDDEDEELFS